MDGERRDDVLSSCFRAIAAADRAGASGTVLDRLREEVRAARRQHFRSRMKIYGLAAALFLAVAVPVGRLATRPQVHGTAPIVPGVTDGEVATDFYPLFYSTVPASEPRIVRLEVPRAALAMAGVEDVPPPGASQPEMVLADVVVGEDGLARAVRFVQPLISNQQEQQR